MEDPMLWTPSPQPNLAANTGDAQSPEWVAASNGLLPQTLSGVFDEAFDLYKRHFTTLMLIVALLYLPMQVIVSLLSYQWMLPLMKGLQPGSQPNTPDMNAVFFLIFAGIVSITLTFGVLTLTTGPISVAVSDIYLGRTTSVRAAYRQGLRHWGRLLGGWIIVGLVCFLVYFVSAFVLVMGMSLLLVGVGMAFASSSNVGSVVMSVFSLVMGLVVALIPYGLCCAVLAKSYIFTTQLVTLEGLAVSDIPGRNAQLVGKTRFWRTFGAICFLPILTFGLQGLISLSIQSTLSAVRLSALPLFLAQTALSTAVGLFFLPYWMIFLTLLYYDYRIRREGLDVRILSSNLPASAIEASPGVPFAAPSGDPSPSVPPNGAEPQ